MGKMKKVLMYVGIAFAGFIVLSVVLVIVLSVLSPESLERSPEVEKIVKPKVEQPKPKPRVEKAKPKVKKVVKKKTEALKLEEIGHKQGRFLVTQCYATNQSGKTWKNYVQVSMSDTKGKVLYYSWDHCWANVELLPKERDYRVAKIPLPKQRPFVVEWEWGGQKLLITYR